MKLELAGPGLAFWRYDDFGADLWAYGLLSIEPVKNEHGESDWWHLGLKLGTDWNFAKQGHFDQLSLIWAHIGPFIIRLFYITDLGGGVHDN